MVYAKAAGSLAAADAPLATRERSRNRASLSVPSARTEA